jgi:hypothetical protein
MVENLIQLIPKFNNNQGVNMNNVAIKASINSDMSLSKIIAKFPETNLIQLVELIKHDNKRIDEFVNTFISDDTYPENERWTALVNLGRKESVFSFITVDEEENLTYKNENLIRYAISRYVALTGIPNTQNVISNNMKLTHRYNSYLTSIQVMADFVKEYPAYIYSEFAGDYYSNEMLLEAIAIVTETE